MICPECGTEFELRRWSAKYCSPKCQKDHGRPKGERKKAMDAAYRATHKEQQRALAATHYEANREVYVKRAADWATNNPEARKAITHKRRAKMSNAGGYFTAQEWFTICFAVGFKCLCCKEQKKLVPDHVVPIALGGSSWLFNIQPLCQSCNAKKGTKIIDYRETLGENHGGNGYFDPQ
jgi:5-methylcytosine-specific restriction endonuclease McrA